MIAKTCIRKPAPPPPPTHDDDEEWVLHTPADGSRPYWYNTATLDVRWTKPTQKRVPARPNTAAEIKANGRQKQADRKKAAKKAREKKAARKARVRRRAGEASSRSSKKQRRRTPAEVNEELDDIFGTSSGTDDEPPLRDAASSSGPAPRPPRSRRPRRPRNAATFPTIWYNASVNDGADPSSRTIKDALT